MIKDPFCLSKGAWKLSLALFCISSGFLQGAVVSTPEGLRDAITASNTTPETIIFASDITLTTFPLPAITNNYTINGSGFTLDCDNKERGLTVIEAGTTLTTVAITNLNIASGNATGGTGGTTFDNDAGAGGGGMGAGGGLFIGNTATVTMTDVTFDGCSATGGTGGAIVGPGTDGGGGGGGGLGGNGGTGGAGADGGGGGGGYITGTQGNGGNAPASGAGGTAGGINLSTGVGAGGVGASITPTDADPGEYGGGGGGAADVNGASAVAGAGGFGGGGGGGSTGTFAANRDGADGGYGGGGGGGGFEGTAGSAGMGGFGGGDGADATTTDGGPGGGGAGLGGAVFVDGTLTVSASSNPITNLGSASGGLAGAPDPGSNTASPGMGIGRGFFITSGSTLGLDITSGTVTLSGGIQSDGLGGGSTVTKSGTGTLSFASQINTYDGTTTITEGTILTDADLNFGISTISMIGPGGTLEAAATFTLSKDIALASGSFDPGGFDFTLSGLISGTGTLVATGSGSLILTNASNSYSGGTSITDVTLEISDEADIGAGDLTLSNGTLKAGASFTFAKTIALTTDSFIDTNGFDVSVTDVISGAGALTKSGMGTLTLGASNTYGGGTTVTGGTLSVSSNDNLGTSTSPLAISSATLLTTGSFANSRPITLTGTSTIDVMTGFTLDMNGNIGGAGSLNKMGDGSLTLAGANNYSLGTIFTAGIVSVSSETNLGSGSLTFSGGTLEVSGPLSNTRTVAITAASEIDTTMSNSLTLNGPISGTGDLTKSGSGTLTIGGGSNTYSGTTTVAAGDLVLNNGTLGPVNLDAGTTLRGTGTIGSLSNSGSVFPGESIGTINVSGSYTQDSSAAYEAEIAPDGTSDLIAATGPIVLDGTLSVIPTSAAGLYRKGQEFTILSGSSRAGMFSTVTIDPSLAATIEYTDTSVLVVLGQSSVVINPTGLKGNAKKVAEYILSCIPNASEDFLDVVDVLFALPSDKLSNALLKLSPEPFGALSWVRFENDQRIASLFTSQAHQFCHPPSEPPPIGETGVSMETDTTRIWFEPLFQWIDQSPQEKQRAYDASTYGFLFGANTQVIDPLIIGGGLGYTFTTLDWEKNIGDGWIHSFYGSLYGRYNFKLGFIESSLLGTRGLYRTSRLIHFSTIRRNAKNNHRGWDFTAHLSGGFDIDCSQNIFFKPSIDLDLVNIYQEAYQERGAGSVSLRVRSQHSTFFRSQVKTQLTREILLDHWCIQPAFSLGWVHESPLSSGKIGSSFTEDCPGSFKVKTYKRDRDLASFTLELQALYDCYLSFSTKYQLLMNGKYMENAFSFHLGYHF